MTDIVQVLKKMSAEIDGPIRSYIGDEEPAKLVEASRQYPYAGGKRMRPAMVIASAGAAGGDRDKAVPLAVAIEYIHNFTLIHDDLMDGDEKRRGMTTIHVGYGMPTAVLAGDALFAKAFEIISTLDVPDSVLRPILRIVTKAVWDLARGQQMDIDNEGRIVSMEEYIETIRLKTSVLFAAGAAGGALCGGGDERTVEAVHEYAMLLGVGFQMFDDYLGIMGDPAKTGKSAGNDIRKGKSTVMVTHALKSIDDPAVLEEFKAILGKQDASEDEIQRARRIMTDSGSIGYAKDLADEYARMAVEKIAFLPPGEDRDFMIALARFSVDRDV
ncbi:MAG: polyprenyl synthetase family protein [Candidatus Methanomethylophilaceae archaeon]|nr:polyprenyl synthetase family protein [Candidatus Methanomethylophilaceae archaeon]